MVAGLDKVLHSSMDWDEAIEKMKLEQRVINDMERPMSAWEPVMDGLKFKLRLKETGQCFLPTRHAMNQMANVGQCRQFDWLLDDPRHRTTVDKTTKEKKILWTRDSRDEQMVRDFVDNHLFQADRLDQDKDRLFRTWTDGTLRAVLSTKYQKVNNLWYLNVLKRLQPDAKVIRWRGNADTLQFDAFLPDTTTDEKDSGYGGIIHGGNSEVGQRSIIATIGVLRLICTNGMISIDFANEGVRQRHIGQLDLVKLEADIIEKMNDSIPGIQSEIQKVLGLKQLGLGDTPMPAAFAQMAIDNHLGKKQVQGVWEAWLQESGIIGADDAKTAFGLQAAVTRFGQTLDNDRAYEYDVIGGRMTSLDRDKWDQFRGRAEHLTPKQIVRAIGEVALAV